MFEEATSSQASDKIADWVLRLGIALVFVLFGLRSSHRAQAPIGSDSSTRSESANGSDISPESLKSSAAPWSHFQGLRVLVWQFLQ